MAKIVLPDILAQFASAGSLNERFQQIEDALNNDVLWRDNPAGESNAMNNDLDMNSNQVINLPYPGTLNSPLRLQDVQDALDSVVGTIPVQQSRQIAAEGQTVFNAPVSWVLRPEIHLVRVDGAMQQPYVDYTTPAAGQIEFTSALSANMIVDILTITPNIAALVGSGSSPSASMQILPAGDGSTEIVVNADSYSSFSAVAGDSAPEGIIISEVSGGVAGQKITVVFPEFAAAPPSYFLDYRDASRGGANISLGSAPGSPKIFPIEDFFPGGFAHELIYDGSLWHLTV